MEDYSRKDGRLFQERWKFIPGKMEDYSRKDGRLRGESKDYVPITAYTITIHKSQGSALELIVGDLSCATDKGPIAASVN